MNAAAALQCRAHNPILEMFSWLDHLETWIVSPDCCRVGVLKEQYVNHDRVNDNETGHGIAITHPCKFTASISIAVELSELQP
jgi:hypothetical protein